MTLPTAELVVIDVRRGLSVSRASVFVQRALSSAGGGVSRSRAIQAIVGGALITVLQGEFVRMVNVSVLMEKFSVGRFVLIRVRMC